MSACARRGRIAWFRDTQLNSWQNSKASSPKRWRDTAANMMATLSSSRRLVALACLLACVAVPRLSAAQARTALSWVREPGAESCIDARTLGRMVERLVGPVLVAAPQGQISIEGRIARGAVGFDAEIVVSNAEGRLVGRRALRAQVDECRAFDDQLAFVIAVAIDPDVALAQLPGEFATIDDPGAELLGELRAHPPRTDAGRSGAAAEPAAGVRDRPSSSASISAERAHGVALQWGVAAGPVAGFAMPGGTNVGARAEVALTTGRWSQRLHGTVWLAREKASEADTLATLDMAQLGIATCPQLWAASSLAFALCGGATLARVSVQPSGFAGTQQERWIIGPTLETWLAWQFAAFARMSIRFGAQSLWPRYRFIYENGGSARDIYRVPLLMPMAQLALELRF